MANRIYIQVDYQDDDAQKQIDQLNQKINAIGTNTVQASAQASKGVQSFSVSINQARSNVDSLAQAIAGMGVGEAIREMITLGDTMNRISAQMGAMSGGADSMAKLRDAADLLGLRFGSVAEAANRLRNAGMKVGDILPVIQSIGIYSVKAGGDIQENFTRAIDGVAATWNKDFLTIKGLVDQMGAIGVHVIPILQKATGQSVNEVREGIRGTSAKALIKDMTDGAGDYADEAKKIADNSPVAEFNRMVNSATELAMVFTKVLGPGISDLLELATKLIEKLEPLFEWFDKLPAPVKDLTVVLVGLTAALWALNAALAVTSALGASGLLGAIAKGFSAAAAAVAGFMTGAGEILTISGEVVALGTGLGEVLAIVAAVGSGLYFAYEWFTKLEAAKKSKTLTPDKMGDQGPLQPPDLDALKKINEQAANLLSEAQKRYAAAGKEAIESVTAEYEVHFRTITEAAKKAHVDAAEAILTVRKALEVSIATEVEKNAEDLRKENVKALEESAVLARKLAIARASVMPDDSFAGRMAVANLTSDADEAQIKQQYAVREQERKNFTVKQIAALQEAAKAGTISETAAVADIKALQDNYREYYVLQEKNAADSVAVHRVEQDAKVNALIIEQHKQLEQELLADRLAGIQQDQQLATAYATAQKPDTLEERLKQIQTVEDAQLAAIEKTHNAQIDAAREELAYYVKLHPDGVGVTEEREKEAREEARLNAQYQTQMQLDRIKAWQEGDEAIIEQQKGVYDQIQGLMGELFDAITGKHKSMWAEIGDVIKKELLGAFKSVLTANLAAQFTQALGFGSVGFARNGLGMVPVFSGAGNPPQPSAAIGANVNYDNVPGGGLQTVFQDAGAAAPGLFGSQFRRFIQGGPAAGGDAGDGGAPVSGGMDQMMNLPFRSQLSSPSWIPKTLRGGGSAMLNRVFGGGSLRSQWFNPSIADGALSTPTSTFGGIVTSKGASALEVAAGMPLLTAGAAGNRRGTAAGIGEMFAGGALTGAGIGTMILPGLGTLIGAGVGAAAGALAGLGEMVAGVESPRNHAKRLAKSLYRVNINNATADQIVNMANQSYGGNVSIAMRSPEVRHMMGLYAAGTGQSMAAGVNDPHGASLVESGGQLFQQQTYQYGKGYVQSSGLPTYGGGSPQVLGAPGGLNLSLNIGGQDAAKFMTGQVVTPDVVSTQYASAMSGSNGRVAQALMMSEPGSIAS